MRSAVVLLRIENAVVLYSFRRVWSIIIEIIQTSYNFLVSPKISISNFFLRNQNHRKFRLSRPPPHPAAGVVVGEINNETRPLHKATKKRHTLGNATEGLLLLLAAAELQSRQNVLSFLAHGPKRACGDVYSLLCALYAACAELFPP